jgi:hypothetical protein
MSDTKKPSHTEELRRIEDAWIQSVLEASGDDIRGEITEAGGDPYAYVELADRMLADAREQYGRERLEQAKAEVAAFRKRESQRATPLDRTKLNTELDAANDEPTSATMLAARKGKGLSDRDEDVVLRARAKLKRLESKDDK